MSISYSVSLELLNAIFGIVLLWIFFCLSITFGVVSILLDASYVLGCVHTAGCCRPRAFLLWNQGVTVKKKSS